MIIIITLLFFCLIGTVIYSVLANKKTLKRLDEIEDRLYELDELLLEDRVVIDDLIESSDKIKEDMKATMLDVEAIANSINVYSKSITGNVAEKVKANVDLFSEWINGEADE